MTRSKDALQQNRLTSKVLVFVMVMVLLLWWRIDVDG